MQVVKTDSTRFAQHDRSYEGTGKSADATQTKKNTGKSAGATQTRKKQFSNP